jgi:hypothetical protein
MTETKPARVLDKLTAAVRALVDAGILKSVAGDKEAYILAAAHLKADGLTVPSERSWRRHINRLRPLWRLNGKRAA